VSEIKEDITKVSGNIHFDVLGFLRLFVVGAADDIEYAYPNDYFDEDNAHVSLQKLTGRIEALTEMLNFIEKA
jgi:hypothetical protein